MWKVKFCAVVFLLLIFVPDADCWFRRRRRRRYSPPCSLHDCQVSSWSEWSPCTHQCGTSGKQTRTRTITVVSSCGGSCPFVLTQTRSCNSVNCQNSGTPTAVLATSTLQPRNSSSTLTTTQTPSKPVSIPSPFIETGRSSFQPLPSSQAVIISPSLTIPAVNSQPLSVVPVTSTIAPSPLSSGIVVASASTIQVTTQPPFIACGGTLSGSSGSFASPGYPGFYSNNLNCSWSLFIPANAILRLQFIVFETEPFFDFVLLSDIFGQRIDRLNGSRSGFTVTVRGDRSTLLRIRFITDSSDTRQGFKAQYSITFAPISSFLPAPSSSAVIATPTPTMQLTTRPPPTGQVEKPPPQITNFLKGNLLNRDEVKGGKEYNELNNDGFKLPCKATGKNLKWTWQHNGTDIFTGSGSKYKVQGDGSLIGESLLPDQSGNYQCFVEDTVTTKKTFSRKVQVLVTIIRPFKSTTAMTIIVDLGQPLWIPCPAHGVSPGAVYTWTGEDDIEFNRSPSRGISPDGALYIMFVTEKDINLMKQLKGISCTMTGANTIYRSGPITLQKRQPGSFDPGTPKSPSWELTPNADETAVEGRNKTLYCFAVGRPPPTIIWKKNGQTIVTGDDFQIAGTYQGRRLDLINVKKSIHEDRYTCEAENSQNGGNPLVFTTTLTVKVAPKWRDSRPPPEKLEIDIQGSGTLLCDAVGDPTPAFTWYKDGVRLISNSRVQVTSNKLTVTNVGLSDDGVYQCIAENNLDMIVSSTWVDVLVNPSASSLPPVVSSPVATPATLPPDVQRALVDLLRSLVQIIQRLQALVGGSFSPVEFENFRNQTLQILQQAENQLANPSSSRLRNVRLIRREIQELSNPHDLVQMLENIQRRLLG